jgi:trypsin
VTNFDYCFLVDYKMKVLFAFLALVAAVSAENYGYWRPDLLKDAAKLLEGDGSRIVGGSPANDGDYPYQLGLRFNNAFRCGGSIISANWILSAAHCLDGGQAASGVTWHGGSVNRLSGGVIFTTAEYMLHPQYSRASLDNDVLVARSNEALTGTNIGPVSMAALNQATPDNAPTVVSGWGLTVPGGSLPTILQSVTVPIIPQATCGSIFSITAK